MKFPGLSTGYFVKSDWPDEDYRGKVHIVLDDKPVCKQKFGGTTVYQHNAMGIREDWVECKNCQKILDLFKKTQKGKDPAVHFVYFLLHDLKKERNLINKRLKRKVPVRIVATELKHQKEYLYKCRSCGSLNSSIHYVGDEDTQTVPAYMMTREFTNCECCIQLPGQEMFVICDLIKVLKVTPK